MSPCSWVEGAAENIVTITSKDSATGNDATPSSTETTGSPSSSKSGLSAGAIAGISIAAAVVLLALAIGVYFFLKRQRQKQAAIQMITSVDPDDDKAAVIADSKSIRSHELSNFGEAHELNHDTQIYQLSSGDDARSELNSNTEIYQLHSDQRQGVADAMNPGSRPTVAYELRGSEVSRVELDGAQKSRSTSS